jgi:hypothetical protein
MLDIIIMLVYDKPDNMEKKKVFIPDDIPIIFVTDYE